MFLLNYFEVRELNLRHIYLLAGYNEWIYSIDPSLRASPIKSSLGLQIVINVDYGAMKDRLSYEYIWEDYKSFKKDLIGDYSI